MKSKSNVKKIVTPKMSKKPLYIVLSNNKENPNKETPYYILSQGLFFTADKAKAEKVMHDFARESGTSFDKEMEKYQSYNWFQKIFHSEPRLISDHFKVLQIDVDKSVDISKESVIWISEKTFVATNENKEKNMGDDYWHSIKLDVYLAGSPTELYK
jgi:hypothetical protein